MPLRLVNKQRTHPIEACDTTFHIISLSIGEKEKLVYDLQHIGNDDGAFDRLLDVIAPAITKIDGFEDPVREVLSQLEEIEQLREIIQAIIRHCALTKAEAKNSHSSSEQHTPESVGSADQSAVPEGGPASTTQTS